MYFLTFYWHYGVSILSEKETPEQVSHFCGIISDALQDEAHESEYSMNEEKAGEQYKIAKADYEAFRQKYSIRKD